MKQGLLSLTLCTLLIPALAHADARYTKKITYSSAEMSGQGMSSTSTTYIKGKRERKETVTQVGPMHMVQTEMTLCDQEKHVRLDSDLKIYVSTSLRPQLGGAAPAPRGPMGATPEKSDPVKSGTGTYTMTYRVEDLGVEKVANLDAHHYRIHMSMVASGCAGDNTTDLDREIWTAANLPRLVCPVRDVTGDFSMKPEGTANPCKIKVIQKGDVKLFMTASAGEVVKEIFYHDGKPMMTTELTEYSSAPLDDSLFSLEGMKSVSDEEFGRLQQEKMMKQFRP